MKRSKMAKYIETRLQDFDIDGKDSKKTYKEFADIFLQELEDLGMLPPSKKVDYLERRAINQLAPNIFAAYHKWDSENATKAD